VLSLEDDAPAQGERAHFLTDILEPCWFYADAPVGGATRIAIDIGQLPFNFQIGKDRDAIHFRPPATPAGEMEVRAGSCEGERIAVLGRNGAGKSTLLQALAGSMDLMQGEVSLDGIAMAHLDPADLRRDVGLLAQYARLFHGTLRENLTLGAGQASDQELVAALSATGALDFVRRLPKGMDHLILEGGLGLSGGQRQALVLSRLLVRQPQVLLLDEPTASLDDITERRLLDNLDRFCQGRTLVIATHRLSVLQRVDRILVLDGGRIVIDDARDAALAKLQGAQA